MLFRSEEAPNATDDREGGGGVRQRLCTGDDGSQGRDDGHQQQDPGQPGNDRAEVDPCDGVKGACAGVLEMVVRLFDNVNGIPPVLFGVFVIWIVAALSAVVDNVPITIALIPVIKGLGETGMDIGPLWWALAFGAGFGGSGTIIGSSANIIVATLSEKTRTPITSPLWLKRGMPVMLVTCTIASILFAIFYRWL